MLHYLQEIPSEGGPFVGLDLVRFYLRLQRLDKIYILTFLVQHLCVCMYCSQVRDFRGGEGSAFIFGLVNLFLSILFATVCYFVCNHNQIDLGVILTDGNA